MTGQVSLSELQNIEKAHSGPSVSRQVLYHQTSEENATNIITNGFKDCVASFGLEGVWLSDEPLWFGTATLIVLLSLTDREIAEYEVVDAPGNDLEPKDYREWFVPAEVIANYGTVHKLAD